MTFAISLTIVLVLAIGVIKYYLNELRDQVLTELEIQRGEIELLLRGEGWDIEAVRAAIEAYKEDLKNKDLKEEDKNSPE